MIFIDFLNALIYTIPDLIKLFLPGFITMTIYEKLRTEKINIYVICLWSLFISYIITLIFGLLPFSAQLNENALIIIYIITGTILPFIIIFICKTPLLKWILLKINYQTINNDIFDDIIDYKEKVVMSLYLKQSNIYYIGTFSLKGKSGGESYIALIDYATVDCKTDEIIHQIELPTSAIFNLQDVEKIELTYPETSEVWKQLKRGNLS